MLPTPLKVRVALHSGEAELRENDYYGPVVNLCARLRSIAHGGQVLVSETTADLIRDRLPAGTSLRDSGTHRLKGLSEPERVFELVHEELPTDYPPPQASRAHAGVGPGALAPRPPTTDLARSASTQSEFCGA